MVMLIGVLFIGVVLDTLRSIFVFIFLTVMLVVDVLFMYWLSPEYVAVIVCVPTFLGVYVCVIVPLSFVFSVNVSSSAVIVMFWFASLLPVVSVSVTVMVIGVLFIGVGCFCDFYIVC